MWALPHAPAHGERVEQQQTAAHLVVTAGVAQNQPGVRIRIRDLQTQPAVALSGQPVTGKRWWWVVPPRADPGASLSVPCFYGAELRCQREQAGALPPEASPALMEEAVRTYRNEAQQRN